MIPYHRVGMELRHDQVSPTAGTPLPHSPVKKSTISYIHHTENRIVTFLLFVVVMFQSLHKHC